MKNKVFNTLLATATLTGAFSAIVPILFAQPASADNDKVTICHKTSSATNPFNIIEISVNALKTHIDHHGDFILHAGDKLGNENDATCNSATDKIPLSITLTGTVRDFNAKGSTGGHDDFERSPGNVNSRGQSFGYGSDKNIVTTTLGTDKKPVFGSGTYSTTSKENFEQWYKNVSGVNESKSYPIELVYTGNGIYTYDSNEVNPNKNGGFFPIDNQLLGNQGRIHNYHFTYEVHTQFTYKPGQTFKFRGDDDVWVYIDGKRVIDIGGVHSAQEASVNLDTLGLKEGQSYDLDLFFAERHTSDSNFRIDTSIQFQSAD